MRRVHRAFRAPAGLGVAAIAVALVPLPAGVVERVYSERAFPLLQGLVTRASNLAPFALLDVLLAAVVAWWIGGVVRDAVRRRRLATTTIAALLRAVAAVAALYLVFVLMWGLNYRRVPLDRKLAFDAAAVSPAAAHEVAAVAVERANALFAPAHAQGWPPAGAIDPVLAGAAAGAQREAGAARGATPARPKRTLLDVYFRRAAVDGMTDPFFLETLLNTDLLPFERPFVTAHEWAHLAGFADEGEANFVGWLTCVRGPAPLQYSGWLFLYTEIAQALPEADRVVVSRSLGAGPRADLRAIADRLRREISPHVSRAGWRVYDRYLRANRVESGAASYQGVVRLVLGTAIGNGVTGLSTASRESPR